MNIISMSSTTRKKLEKKLYAQMQQKRYLKFYRKLCKINGIEDKEISGEKEWIKKWTGCGLKPQPIYYRLYQKYVGQDANIVPEDICRASIEPCLYSARFLKFYGDKNMWDSLFPDGLFPPTILRRIEGLYYDVDYNCIPEMNDKKLNQFLKEANSKKLVFKITRDTNSSQGFHTINEIKGAFFLDTGEKLTVKILNRLGEDFIIQPFMKQHSYLSQFCKTSVNPIRLTTYKSVKDDKVHVLKGSVLRIGFEGEENDGTHGNGKFVGINLDGTLKHQTVDFYGRESMVFNGIDFSDNYKIPNFEKVKAAAVSIAENVKCNRLLAFDIMLDEEGQPKVFEFNLEAYSIWLAQFTGETAFGEFTNEILEYTKSHYKTSERLRLY